MKNANLWSVRTRVTACLLLGWTGCAGSAPTEIIAAPSQTTTTSAVPTANGTYDRSMDPGASNAGVGTTKMRPERRDDILTVTPVVPAREAALTDGQIAGIASRIDLAEIDAGKIALAHAKSASVRQFAQHMVNTHTAVELNLNAMIKAQSIAPAESLVCDQLTRDTQAQNQSLMGQSGSDFDRSYLTAQLRDHQDVLELLDSKLIVQAQNPQLKAALETTRTKVVEHIQMAKEALASLPPP